MKLWKIGAIIVAMLALAGAAMGIVTAQSEEDLPVAGRVGDFLGRLAENLGISQEELEAAIDETQLEIIDEKVADGTLTEEQAAKLRERVESGEGLLFPRFGRPHHGGHGGFALYEFAEAADLTVRELIDAWGDDQTLQQVLEGLGVDVAAVKAEALAAQEARLAEAVADGKIDQARADEVLANAAGKLDELLAQVGPPQFPQHGPFRGEFGNGRLPDGAAFPGFPAPEPVDEAPIF